MVVQKRRRQEPLTRGFRSLSRRRSCFTEESLLSNAITDHVKRYFLQRLLLLLPTLLGAATLVFFFIHLIPGDPVEVMLGETASAVDRARLRAALGLERPLLEQYFGVLAHAVCGDLGRSLRDGTPIAALVLGRLPATLLLAGAAGVIALAVAIPLGALSARHRGRWPDAATTGFALIGASVPSFFLGP